MSNPSLHAKNGAHEGKKIEITQKIFTIGREVECNYIDEGPGVSRIHCFISKKANFWFIEDNDSSNGVYVNDKQVSGKYKLDTGDKVQIGDSIFEFEDPAQKKEDLNKTKKTGKQHNVMNLKHNIKVQEELRKMRFQHTMSLILIAVIAALLSWHFTIKYYKTEQTVVVNDANKVVESVTNQQTDLVEDSTCKFYVIKTEPTNAAVAFNGEIVGKTPYVVSENIQKVNEYKIAKQGYELVKDKVSNHADNPMINYTMTQEKGTIRITSKPSNCAVIRDDMILLGQTPLMVEDLKNGEKYKFKVVESGFKTTTKEVTFKDSEPQQLHFDLETNTCKLAISSTPIGADVYVDGVFVGKTPAPKNKNSTRSDLLFVRGLKAKSFEVKLISPTGIADNFKTETLTTKKIEHVYRDLRMIKKD